MTGRASESDASDKEVLVVVLRSLVEDGVARQMPVWSVDPNWSPRQVDLAVRLYAIETRLILSHDHDEKISTRFSQFSDMPMKALERNAQLREAHLTARLTALRTFGTERAINPLPTFSLTGGAPEPEDGVSAETALLAPAGTLIQPAVPQDMCTPPSAAWNTSDLVDEHVAGPQAVRLRTRSVLTISTLLEHYSEASKTACEATPRAYLSELPKFFHRMAKRGALTKDVW